MTMANLLTAIGSIVEEALGWVGDVIGVITSNPLLLIFVIVPLVGLGVGLTKRLLNM